MKYYAAVKKEQTSNTCDNIDELQTYSVKRKKMTQEAT